MAGIIPEAARQEKPLESTDNISRSISRTSQGYLIALVGTAIWSTTAIFIRYLTENYHLPALTLAFWRDLIVFAALFLVIARINPKALRVPRKQLRFLLSYGIILSLFNAIWTISVALNGAATATVMVYSSAAFTAVFGWRFFKERLGPVKMFAITASLLGCAAVSGAYDLSAWQLNFTGVLTGLISGLAFAAYSLMGKAASIRQLPSWTTMLYTFGVAAFLLLLYSKLPLTGFSPPLNGNLFWLGKDLVAWLILIALAVGPTIGGYGLYTMSLGYLPASVANLIATLEPALTAVLAYFFLGERLTGVQLAGSLLIIIGVAAVRLRETQE